MRVSGLLLVTSLIVSACSGTNAPSYVAPYVAEPLANLGAGEELYVTGNHQGWGTRVDGEYSRNNNGPKLQRFDTTGTAGEYTAVFRNNITLEFFGTATFTMPASGVTYEGTTSEGYDFEITRSNDVLVYTLTGQYMIATTLGATGFAGGGFATGMGPAAGDMPTSGTASYAGDFLGHSTIAGEVTGDFAMDANFLSRALIGSLTGLEGEGGEAINDMVLLATIGSGTNAFSGIVTVGATTGSGADFTFDSEGVLEGAFYGPAGEEIGGTMRIIDGQNYLTGSFGGALVLP